MHISSIHYQKSLVKVINNNNNPKLIESKLIRPKVREAGIER